MNLKPSFKSQLLENYCKEHKIDYFRVDHWILMICLNGRWFPFFNYGGPSSSLVHKRILDYKHLVKELLSKNGLNVVPYLLFDKKNTNPLLKFAENNYPLVIKPIASSRGQGVVVGIKNEYELLEAVRAFDDKSGWGLAEKQFQGFDYRVFVCDGKVVSVTLRDAANVVGDGERTVYKLIEEKNALRKKNVYLQNYLIPTTEKELERLKTYNMKLTDIPAKGEKIYLRYQSNLSAGGDSTDLTDEAHEDFKNLALKAVQTIPFLNYAGVDFIAKNICSRPDENNYIISELEFSPAPVGMYPLNGKARDMFRPMLDFYAEKYLPSSSQFFKVK